jgi:hypothetical protein
MGNKTASAVMVWCSVAFWTETISTGTGCSVSLGAPEQAVMWARDTKINHKGTFLKGCGLQQHRRSLKE